MTTTVMSSAKGFIAVAGGLVFAALAAFLTQAVAAAAPLFDQSSDVPSVVGPAPSAALGTAVERARAHVRAAMLEQNLPGISVAVGAGGTLTWAEGFGWRDVWTRTPVTPETRFHIGTAAFVVLPMVERLGLANTGTDRAADWSPEHVGEPEEDAPPFALVRRLILQPLGLAPAEYPLRGERATFYVPRGEDHDPRRGRRLMYMRDLGCCANGLAFSSTPSDLVRFALATGSGPVDGELAGGRVMSLVTGADDGVVVVVASNMAYADTRALAERIRDAFAE